MLSLPAAARATSEEDVLVDAAAEDRFDPLLASVEMWPFPGVRTEEWKENYLAWAVRRRFERGDLRTAVKSSLGWRVLSASGTASETAATRTVEFHPDRGAFGRQCRSAPLANSGLGAAGWRAPT